MENVMLKGLKLIQPDVFKDERGYFFESYNRDRYVKDHEIEDVFIQDNESKSARGVLRGLHYQSYPHEQSKLVRVVKGSVIDFVLDIRQESVTKGKLYFVLLTAGKKNQFYIPHGFAHGFYSLEDETVFSYKCDSMYDKESDSGFSMFDPKLDLLAKLSTFAKENGCPVDLSKLIVSDKDKSHPNFFN